MRQTSSGCFVIEDDADSAALIRALREYPCSGGIDCETYPLDPKRKTPDAAHDPLLSVGVSIYPNDSLEPYMTFYGEVQTVPSYLAALAETMPGTPWYAHNAMFDATVLRHHGVALGEHWGDARIIAYLLGEPEAGLKPLLWQHLSVNVIDYSDLLAQYDCADLRGVPTDVVAEYCGSQDAELCVQLERFMREKLEPRQLDVYDLERDMVNILIDMHMEGIKFDRDAAAPLLVQALKGKENLDGVIGPLVEQAGFVQWEYHAGNLVNMQGV